MKNGYEIDNTGNKFWRKDGLYHREDGPAVELISGAKFWYKNGLLHRLDGPASQYSDGTQRWCLDGVYFNSCKTQKEFEHYLKLKAFL